MFFTRINLVTNKMQNSNNYPTYSWNGFTTQYEFIQFSKKAKLTVLYIHGLSSNPWGRKPEAVKELCQELGLNFYRFELLGHGIDSFNYEKTDFNLWKAQILNIIDTQIKGDFIIVGHCIGGWLGLLAAQERPQRLKGLICTSTAPNLTELMEMQMSPAQRAELQTSQKVIIKIERMVFTFTEQFIKTGIENAILEQREISITCPVQLIQGLQDTFIDWKIIYKIAQKLSSKQVTIKLLKNSNHHLQHPLDLAEINNSLREIIQNL